MVYASPEASTCGSGWVRPPVTMRLPRGAHTAYFKADGTYESVVLDNGGGGVGGLRDRAGPRRADRTSLSRDRRRCAVGGSAKTGTTGGWSRSPCLWSRHMSHTAAWASYGSWWEGDDFHLIARVFTPGERSPGALLASYAGHMVPATLLPHLASSTSRLPSRLELRCGHAHDASGCALADVGFLGCCSSPSGAGGASFRRWRSSLSPPSPCRARSGGPVGLQTFRSRSRLCWAMACQLHYLRHRRPGRPWRPWPASFGLAFYEKSIL